MSTAFPYTNFREGFRFVPDDGLSFNEGPQGKADARQIHNKRISGRYVVPLEFLTKTQLDAYLHPTTGHLNACAFDEFTFVDPETGNTILAIYDNPAISSPRKVAGNLYALTVYLRYVKIDTYATANQLELEAGGTIDDEAGNPLEFEE